MADLFAPSLSTQAMLEATSGRSWVAGMLEFEAALARAEAALGVIPEPAATAIQAAARSTLDLESIAERAVASANPAVPLVHDLTAAAGDGAAWVHWGATSQDVVDTALMLVARKGLGLLLDDLDRAAAAAAGLARRHRQAPMAARTLLQQALPTTFGLKAAGWLEGLLAARRRLLEYRAARLALQLGGAAGTLAALGDRAPAVVERTAAELELPAPALPWHTERTRIVELGGLLAEIAGAAAKVAQDVVLLAQTEVAEVAESAGPGRGASSTLPQKRNPARSVLALAAARSAFAACSLLQQAAAQEQERSAGWWQLEGDAVTHALRYAAGAIGRVADVLEGLEVDEARMRVNLASSGGLLMAESVMMRLAGSAGRERAHRLVAGAVERSRARGTSFREELLNDSEVAAALTPEAIASALEPESYLGAAGLLVDRALAEYQATIGRQP